MNIKTKILAASIISILLISQSLAFDFGGKQGPNDDPVVTVDPAVSQEETCDSIDENNTYTWPWHSHSYTNTGGPTLGVEHWAYIKKMRILLDDDFMDYVDLDAMLCATNVTGVYVDCDNDSYQQDNDTTVTVSLNESQQYIEWNWGEDSSDWPVISGDMYEVDIRDDAVYTETIEKGLKFNFKESTPNGTDVTTNSEIYIAFYTWSEENGWIADDDWGDWHWNTHSSPASTSYSCEEEEAHYCADMTLHSPASVISEVDARDTIIIDISTVDENNHTWDEDDDGFYGYKYWALNYNNQTAGGKFFTSAWDFFGDTILYTDESDTVRYKNGAPGDQIFVCAVDQNNNCIQACQVEIESPICTDLDLSPNSITAGEIPYSIPFTITAQDSYGGAWDGIAIWDTSNPTGIFSDNNTHTNNVTVTYSDNQQAATISVEDNEFPQYCADSATINFEPQLACLSHPHRECH